LPAWWLMIDVGWLRRRGVGDTDYYWSY